MDEKPAGMGSFIQNEAKIAANLGYAALVIPATSRLPSWARNSLKEGFRTRFLRRTDDQPAFHCGLDNVDIAYCPSARLQAAIQTVSL